MTRCMCHCIRRRYPLSIYDRKIPEFYKTLKSTVYTLAYDGDDIDLYTCLNTGSQTDRSGFSCGLDQRHPSFLMDYYNVSVIRLENYDVITIGTVFGGIDLMRPQRITTSRASLFHTNWFCMMSDI